MTSADLERLLRWENAGGTWEVTDRGTGTATVALLRCDGGEQADGFTSEDPVLLSFLDEQDSHG